MLECDSAGALTTTIIIITIKFFNFFSPKNNIKMIKYHRIDISESIDVNKANASGVCIICHY